MRCEDSLLLVVDAQERFYGPERRDVDRHALGAAVARLAWLVGVAAALDVPVVATEEDAERNGPTDPEVAARLPASARVLPKAVFSAAGEPAILDAVRATARRTVVLAGLETDVCVAHSALGLRDAGYRAVVVRDATYAPGESHVHGLARLVAAGIEAISAKEAYYDWVRTLAAARGFEAQHPELAQPPGFSL